MPDHLIVEQSKFEELCAHIRQAGEVAFDTEFVSEFTYRPELCLLQFATRERCVAVDPYEVRDLQSWWDIMAGGEVNVVVHGGREEVRFCLTNANRKPGQLVDVQVAEGLRSPSFPLGYTALVARVLGKRTHGKETRTDWRRRPLTDQQIHYALEDVEFVLDIWDKQRATLGRRQRLGWCEMEFARMIDEVASERTRENWRRIPGIQRLNPRELAVLRELFQWRELESQQRDRPARKTLRDDLLIELARRQPRTVNDLTATRDMNRSDYRRAAPEMIEAINRALELPAADLPGVEKAEKKEEEHALGQLLGIALANLCLQQEVAMQLVGTSSDLRQLVRWHVYGEKTGEPPRLTQGWRAEVCGAMLTDVLDGKIALRVADPHSDHPLIFERVSGE
ncbi:MAG TPA: HRDC domain-containing protein [Planctomycetaceae bacterium]|nr:HRDC domain-containing protein [Planctomycetaceae bacterium]